jgi:hypothetical protein
VYSFAAFTGNSSDTSSPGTIRRSAPAQPFLPKLIQSQVLIEKIVDIGALAGGPAKSVPLTNTQVNADLTMVVIAPGPHESSKQSNKWLRSLLLQSPAALPASPLFVTTDLSHCTSLSKVSARTRRK